MSLQYGGVLKPDTLQKIGIPKHSTGNAYERVSATRSKAGNLLNDFHNTDVQQIFNLMDEITWLQRTAFPLQVMYDKNDVRS